MGLDMCTRCASCREPGVLARAMVVALVLLLQGCSLLDGIPRKPWSTPSASPRLSGNVRPRTRPRRSGMPRLGTSRSISSAELRARRRAGRLPLAKLHRPGVQKAASSSDGRVDPAPLGPSKAGQARPVQSPPVEPVPRRGLHLLAQLVLPFGDPPEVVLRHGVEALAAVLAESEDAEQRRIARPISRAPARSRAW